jgi:hypothetical protein
MLESTLATTDDANLILKLYELRTEAIMRRARAWLIGEFFPETAEEFFAVANGRGSQEKGWYLQVTTYWEMAAAFVLHGALNADLFIDCNSEPFFIYAKFQPMLAEIRRQMPGFLSNVGQIVEESASAQAKVAQMAKIVAGMRPAAAAADK